MIRAGPSLGTKNSTLKKPPSNPSAGRTRAATSVSSAFLSGGSADGYSKRSKLFVPSYFDGVRDADRRHLPLEDVALERDLVALEQLLRQETAHGVRMETGQRGDPRIPRHVGVDLLELLDLERIVDTTHALGETADDGLHEERRAERRPAVEQREARGRGRHRRTLQGARSRLELAGDERARRRARQASPFRDQRREQGRAILRADDAVGRQPVALLEELHRVELVALRRDRRPRSGSGSARPDRPPGLLARPALAGRRRGCPS